MESGVVISLGGLVHGTPYGLCNHRGVLYGRSRRLSVIETDHICGYHAKRLGSLTAALQLEITLDRQTSSLGDRRTVSRVYRAFQLRNVRGIRPCQQFQNIPSVYACHARKQISPKSTRNKLHERNEDQESSKCSTNDAVKSNADCHA